MDEVVALSSMLRARQLSSSSPSNGTKIDAIPILTRSLSQVHSDSTRLLSARVASTSDADSPAKSSVHPAALRLFASVGFEVDRLHRAVSSVDTAATFVDLPTKALDPHRHPTWLAPRALDDARLSMNEAIREAAQKTAVADLVAANARLTERLSAKWDRVFPSETPLTPLTPRTPASAHTARRVRARSESGDAITVNNVIDERYVEAIRGIALHGEAHSAPFTLFEVAQGIPDSPHFVESLAVIASIARHSQRDEPATEDMTVWGARVVLEDQFAECIPGLPQKPRLAAAAAVVPAVSRYVGDLQKQGRLGALSESQLGVYNGSVGQQHIPLWPQVYFCMRVGHVGAALMVLQGADRERNSEAAAVTQFCLRFLQGRDHAFAKFRRSRVPVGDRDRAHAADPLHENVPMVPGYLIGEKDYIALHRLYTELAWSSKDPYFRVCIVLLLRLELLSTYGSVPDVQGVLPGTSVFGQQSVSDKHLKCSPALPEADMSQLFGSVEDYMWFRLWLCRTPIESDGTSRLTDFRFVCLDQVQADIRSCGSSHFDPDDSQPLVYAFVLVCCGLYDEAVASLATHGEDFSMHPSAHLAIVLYHLRWTKDVEACHSVLMKYVSIFSRLFPAEAALYLMTVRDRSVLRKLLVELVVTTGEFAVLLGSERDRDRNSGALADHLSSASVPLPSGFSLDDMTAVRIEAALKGASDASQREEFSIAADLYTLAGKPVESMEMVMRNLADVVDKQASSRRPIAVAQAKQILSSARLGASPKPLDVVMNSLKVLLGISTFFDEYWTWRFGSAWAALREMRVLPLTTSEISSSRRNLTSAGGKYSDCIQRCVHDVLKVALHIAERALELGCVEKAPPQTPVSNLNADGQPRQPDTSEIKTLCIFAGLLRISDVEFNERLIRIELLLS